MIRYRETTEMIPFGRDVKKLKADFVGGECPSWLVLPDTSTYSNNGVDTPASSVIKTADVSVSEMDVIGLQLNNLRLSGNESTTPYPSISIRLVHTDGNGNETESLGVYGENLGNSLRYKVGDTVVYEDTKVGKYVQDFTKSVLVSPTAQYPGNPWWNYANRPKNIGVLIMPIMGCIHVLFDNKPVYSKMNLDEITYTVDGVSHTGVDFSGGVDEWHFEVTSNKGIHASSIDFEIHQSY